MSTTRGNKAFLRLKYRVFSGTGLLFLALLALGLLFPPFSLVRAADECAQTITEKVGTSGSYTANSNSNSSLDKATICATAKRYESFFRQLAGCQGETCVRNSAYITGISNCDITNGKLVIDLGGYAVCYYSMPFIGFSQSVDPKLVPSDLRDLLAASSGCSFSCSHTNRYMYTFRYEFERQGVWSLLDKSNARKCESVKVAFSPAAEWFAKLTHDCQPQGTLPVVVTGPDFACYGDSPPTDLLACADQDSCLATAKEHELTPTTFGKGVQKIPASFVDTTQKSLSFSITDSSSVCTNGVCVAYVSGARTLTATAPASSYFGQCRGTTPAAITIKTNEGAIPAVTSTLNVNFVNQAPTATVDIPKDTLASNEEVTVTCNAVDPDCPNDAAHKDKIAKIKWTCADSGGSTGNCFFQQSDGTWSGSVSRDIPAASQANPYSETIKFKATGGTSASKTYTVTCEATDNDANNPLSGKGSDNVVVTRALCQDNDGSCDENCNPCDIDCATCCGTDGRCNAQCQNPCDLDCPSCVIAAGTCIVTRTNPTDTDKVFVNDPVTFQANVIGGDAPAGYKWYCDSTKDQVSGERASSQKTDSQTCSYPKKGAYSPLAKFKDSSGKEHTCDNAQGVRINVGERGATNPPGNGNGNGNGNDNRDTIRWGM